MDRLLRCDVAVTQSSEITQFFMPKDYELQPDYTKNRWEHGLQRVYFIVAKLRFPLSSNASFRLSRSVMLLLSDDIPDGPVGGGHADGGGGGGGITHPFVTQTYRCVDAYETKDTKNRPFKVGVDEKLDVLIKDPSGECLGFPHASS